MVSIPDLRTLKKPIVEASDGSKLIATKLSSNQTASIMTR